MTSKFWSLFIVLPLLALPLHAQESIRPLEGTGGSSAFLTPGQIDRWIFNGEKGETIIAHVVSKEFDPILGLAQKDDKDDKVFLEVDDPGNESRFSFRLPEKGEYKIRVNAFKFKGGGNYTLTVQRFQANPITIGKPLIGTFDREGKSYYYFDGTKDQILIPQLKGTSSEAWRMLDFKGREMPPWSGTIHLEEKGLCHLVVSGPPDYRHDLLLREAQRRELTVGADVVSTLLQGEAEILSFKGKPGEFRLLEVEKKGELKSRLIYAAEEKKTETHIARKGEQPEIAFLPMASRGGRLRYAAILGREGRYQLQFVAETAVSYKLNLKDPSVPIEIGKENEGNLPVGGAGFYRFNAVPGQLFQAGITSQKFVPVLRLYDSNGIFVGASSENADALEGRITHMVLKEGTYRLQVSSLGDGGGGDFRLALTEIKLREIQVGGRAQGTVQPGAMDFCVFQGKEGQTVFLSVRSSAFEPVISIRSPDGVLLTADNKGSATTGSLIALKLPRTGRYTIWISSRRGAGDYTARLIDAE